MKNDKIAKDFKFDLRQAVNRMPFVVVYDNETIDYKGKFVARLFDMEQPTNLVILAKTLEELRGKLPTILTKANRTYEDSKNIIEVYF